MALKIRRDPLNTLRTFAREYGDIVLFHVLMQGRILLNHPDFIEQVLVIQQNKFHKSELTRRITGRMLGQGLLTSEGDFWRRQRRLVQPSFHRSRINEYGATMREIAQAHISGWRDGEVRDLAQEMTALTLDNAVRTLFSTALPGEAQQVGRAMTFLMRYSLARQRSPIRIPENWPTPKNRRANRDLAFMDSLVYRMIAERKSEKRSNRREDLLSFELVREYIDVGQSGATDSRPELNKLMDDARKRQFDAIIVWRFDRFARSTKHLLAALEEFLSLGIQFISYQENVDTSTPLGQALFTIVSAVAQLERELIRERVTAGIRNARANGKKLGRPKSSVDRAQVLQLRERGHTLQQIATDLGIGYGTVRARLLTSDKT
jgi:DNA invertase Pin-like site-specific DNA recombinase